MISRGLLFVPAVSIQAMDSNFSAQFSLASHLTEHNFGDEIKCLHDAWVGKAVVDAYSLLAREDDIRGAHDCQVLREIGHAHSRCFGEVADSAFSTVV